MGALNIRPVRQRVALAAFAAALFGAGLARGQTATEAEQLWERGAADWKAGKLDTGCPAIEESYRLDPQAGALFVSAECHSQWGKLLAAVQRYEAYLALEPQLSQAEHGRRLARARASVAQLKPLIPVLELVLPTPSSGEVNVSLDGTPLPPEQLGRPLPVEVGPHRIETRRGTGTPWRVELTVARGEARRIELDVPVESNAVAVPAPAPVATAPAATTAPPAAPAAPKKADASVSSGHSSTLGWVAGGVGVAGVLVGSVAGLAVLHQKNIVDDECDSEPDATGQKSCSDRGMQAVERGQTLATVATVGFGVGLAGLVTGAFLLLWDSSPTPPEHVAAWRPVLQAGPGGAFVGVSQAW